MPDILSEIKRMGDTKNSPPRSKKSKKPVKSTEQEKKYAPIDPSNVQLPKVLIMDDEQATEYQRLTLDQIGVAAFIESVSQFAQTTEIAANILQRNYREVKGYGAYRHFAKWCYTALVAERLFPKDALRQYQHDFAFAGCQVIANCLYQKRPIRCYWIDKALVEVLKDAALPSNVGNMDRILPGGVFFLPNDTVISPDGYSVTWVAFMHLIPGEFDEYHSIRICTSLGPLNIRYYSCADLSIYDSATRLPHRPYGIVNCSPNEIDQKVEQEFLDTLNRLVIGVLLYLQTYPDRDNWMVSDVSADLAESGRRQSKKSKDNLLSPCWIGKGFDRNRDVKPINKRHQKTQSTRERGPIAIHWRRGHIRNQVCGKGRKERKQISIPWVLVNSGNAE